MRSCHHGRLICKQREKGVAAYTINQGEAYCHTGSPPKQAAHRGAKSLMIARSVKLAAQSLACIGKAVHNVREQHIELHEQSVNRQHYLTLPRTGRSEKQHYGNHAQRAQKYVAVYLEDMRHCVAPPHALP